MRVTAIILAAGISSRMGRNKMLLRFQGETLVMRAVRTASDAGCDPVVVVVGPDEAAIRRELAGAAVDIVANPDPATPPGRSLQLGIRCALDADAIVMCLGDMVDQTPEMIRALVEKARAPQAGIVVSDYEGQRAPPYLVTRDLFAEALALEPARLVHQLATRHPDRVVSVPFPRESLTDVDTPEELALVRKRTS